MQDSQQPSQLEQTAHGSPDPSLAIQFSFNPNHPLVHATIVTESARGAEIGVGR
jgi:hypothetical protein